jgi:hypothetical protein
MNYNVDLSSSWSEFKCNPETDITRIRGPQSKVNTLTGCGQASLQLFISHKDKPLGSHVVS